MDKKLHSRPNLDHLRQQAKALLSSLQAGEESAVQTFIEHLPAARSLSPQQVREAGYRLADAQSTIARQSGFSSWPSLALHVEQLRAMEGVWDFVSLEVDGTKMDSGLISNSRLLLDGDRFRMESPEADYEGVFTIDVDADPKRIDIEFIEGPEAGNWSYGIFEVNGDEARICLGFTGVDRPSSFVTTQGSGHALEHLRRSVKSRPVGVKGVVAPEPIELPTLDETGFEYQASPVYERLQGEWKAVELIRDGAELPGQMLSAGKRIGSNNETKATFGGKVMVHAKMRIDESKSPIQIDYLNIGGPFKGTLQLGIMQWLGEDVQFCMSPPGADRPTDFVSEPGSGRTLSKWTYV